MAKREYILDIARVAAILFIMLFHFYSCQYRIDEGEYPYGGNSYFKYGFLGVQFFFVLAGYVLIPSLERSSSFGSFWKKKLVRLGIPLVICTFVTYIFCVFVDINYLFPSAHLFKNVIVSCLFIRPDLVHPSLSWVNGSTWFLWPMIEFFIVSSIAYFCFPKYFEKIIIAIQIALPIGVYCLRRIVENYFLTNKLGIDLSPDTMLQIKDWMWTKEYTKYAHLFLFGIGCYWLKSGKKVQALSVCIVCALINLLLIVDSNYHIVYAILVLFLLYSMIGDKINPLIYKSKGLRLCASIGESTYSVFLLHETIGMVLINRFAPSWGEYAYLYPVMLIILFFIISYFGYKYIEKPLSHYVLSL